MGLEIDERTSSLSIDWFLSNTRELKNAYDRKRCLQIAYSCSHWICWHFGCVPLQMIRDEVASGKQEKEVYKKLQETYGDTVLYTPPFDSQTAILWLLPVSVLPITSQHTYCQDNLFQPFG